MIFSPTMYDFRYSINTKLQLIIQTDLKLPTL